MISTGRARFGLRGWVAVALTLAIVLPLGWMWWSSRLPGSYSALEMGYMDYGGKPPAGGSAHHDMGQMAHGGGLSVNHLDTVTTKRADEVFDLTAREQTRTLPGGAGTARYTLNGTSPGPVLEVQVGDVVEVRLHNASVEGGVALHWHGVDVPNAEDGVAGVTQDAVRPGESYTYRWVAPHVGTFWYHSHQLSHEQVEGGLFGGIVVRPRTEPKDAPRELTGLSHLFGKQTLNGRPGIQRVSAEPGDRYRVRLVNTDNGPLTAWSNVPYRLLAVDGYDVHQPAPVEGRAVDIPAGGRADLEVEVPDTGVARVELIGGIGYAIGPAGAATAEVVKPVRNLDLLDYGTRTGVGFDPTRPDRKFDYSIGRRPGFLDGRPGMWWSVNGHLYPDMPMFVVADGDVVTIRISNHSGQPHPMHLHGHHAIVVRQDGKPVTGSPWWFDSLDVPNGSTFDIAFVADNPGVWMDHCHNLVHAKQGLVTHLMYEGVTTPYRLGEDSGNEPE